MGERRLGALAAAAQQEEISREPDQAQSSGFGTLAAAGRRHWP
jgi:hypothetical protein